MSPPPLKTSQSLKNSFKALQDASFGLLSCLWVHTLKTPFQFCVYRFYMEILSVASRCAPILHLAPISELWLSANLALSLEDDE